MRISTEKYILDKEGNPQVENDLGKWGKYMESAERHVAQDSVDGIKISTVFLGLDHNYGDGAPVLWETMIFGGSHDQYCERYASKEGALAGHKKAVDMVKREQKTIQSFMEDSNVHRR